MPASDSSPASSVSSERSVLVEVGGSAGAIGALTSFFDHLLDQPDEVFVVVVHMPPEQKSSLSEVLASHTSMPVQQVGEPVAIQEDHVYVAPPGRALVIDGRMLTPVAFEGTQGRQAPIDQFFRSFAEYGPTTVGVVLSGASSDGTVGLRVIKEAGGLAAAQDPNEAEYDLMPRSAVQHESRRSTRRSKRASRPRVRCRRS